MISFSDRPSEGISIYAGPRGSGKSLHAIRVAAQYYLSRGSYVLSNLKAKPALARVASSFGSCQVNLDLQWRLLTDAPDKVSDIVACVPRGTPERRTLIIIDECALWWPQVAMPDEEWKKWLVQSRKDHVDIILIIQAVQDLHVSLRRQAAYEYQHSTLANTPGLGLLTRMSGVCKHTLCARGHAMAYGRPQTAEEQFYLYFGNRQFYACYDTLQQFSTHKLLELPSVPLKHHGPVQRSVIVLANRPWILWLVAIVIVTGCARKERRDLARLESEYRQRLTELDRQRARTPGGDPRPAPGPSTGAGRPLSQAGGTPEGPSAPKLPDIPFPVVDIDGRSGDMYVVIDGLSYGPGDVLPSGHVLSKIRGTACELDFRYGAVLRRKPLQHNDLQPAKKSEKKVLDIDRKR